MQQMKNHIYLILLSLLVIPACKKSALPAAGGNTLNKTVLTLPGYFQSVDSFIYVGQQRLAEIISASSDLVARTLVVDTITFQYDASGYVSSWTQTIGAQGKVITYELSYDGNGNLVKALAVPVMSDIEFSDFSFAYDAQGHLVSDSVFAQHLAGIPSAGIMSYDDYTYEEDGNVASMQSFGSRNTGGVGAPFTAGFLYKYSYDSGVNPFYHSGIPFYCYNFEGTQLLSRNNQVGGTTKGTSTPSPYIYAYFSNGLPREQTASWSTSNGTVTQSTEYFYQ
jgi:hypothetical protein